ncbi:MAG: matrixin family metalloprotease [Polyangiaceae bacterium]|nr:matrixin family metalloprotease [Polyangiaceae bacterium]
MKRRAIISGAAARQALLAAVALSATSAPTTAAAYCQAHTCQDDHTCQPRGDCEYVGGNGLSWRRACILVSTDSAGAPSLGLSAAAFEAEVTRSFALWTEANCPNGGHPSIEILMGERARCEAAEYNDCGPNANAVVVHEGDWPYSADAVGVTRPFFSLESGEILDADIELNAALIASEGYSVATVLAHEIGHFLGLEHSSDEAAVMFERYKTGGDPALDDDDIAGVCMLYPPGVSLGECDPTPINGFTASCSSECTVTGGGDGSGNDGCTIIHPFRPTSGSLGALGLVCLLALRRRRSSITAGTTRR